MLQIAPSFVNHESLGALKQNAWLFLEDAFIRHSPTRKQLTVTQELKIRESIYDFVIRLGTSLKLSGETILAATIYINRFYMRYPITTSKYFVACAAIAISSKLNDTYRPPDKIALSACIIKNPNRRVDEHSDLFWQWRDQLLYREELILKSLNFELNTDLPYSIRDALLSERTIDQDNNIDSSKESNIFNDKLNHILKNVVSSIEMLSSLPILISYDMKTFFGTMLVLTILEAKEVFIDSSNESILNLPKKYLSNSIGTNVDSCFKCYNYILNLLKFCDNPDPKLASHKMALKKIPVTDKKSFFELANDD